MNPKISIIVPVYKVETYIHRCIDSILNQTFTDFELILVDDGSPDNCGKICDEYANKDSRVKVIHKKNGGLSDARNAGLDIAIGDYIGFVDSDDYIECDMYEILYNMCMEHNCDIANCTCIIHYPNRDVINTDHKLIIHKKQDAMRTLIEGKLYDECFWDKLFKRELFNNLRFKTGIIYEDTDLMYKVFDNIEKICSIGEPKYHYIKHENSIMDKAIKNISIDAILIYDEMYDFIEKNYPDSLEFVLLKLSNNAMSVLNLITKSSEYYKYKDKYDEVTSILNKHFLKILRMKYHPYTVKLLLIATRLHPKLYKNIIGYISRKRGK